MATKSHEKTRKRMLLRNIWATDHTDQHGLMPFCIFRALLCPFVATHFAAGKKSVIIRAIRGHLFAAGKKNPASAGL
jgi:hypothetical protein